METLYDWPYRLVSFRLPLTASASLLHLRRSKLSLLFCTDAIFYPMLSLSLSSLSPSSCRSYWVWNRSAYIYECSWECLGETLLSSTKGMVCVWLNACWQHTKGWHMCEKYSVSGGVSICVYYSLVLYKYLCFVSSYECVCNREKRDVMDICI